MLYLPGFVPLGKVTEILLSLLIFIIAFEIAVPFDEITFDLASFKLTDFEIVIATAVGFPGTILVEGVVVTGLVVGLAVGDGVALGDAVGVADAVGVGVGVGVGVPPPPPPPPLAGVVDAGVTPAIVIEVDSFERVPAPIAFVAKTCAEYCPAESPEKTCDDDVVSLISLVWISRPDWRK